MHGVYISLKLVFTPEFTLLYVESNVYVGVYVYVRLTFTLEFTFTLEYTSSSDI